MENPKSGMWSTSAAVFPAVYARVSARKNALLDGHGGATQSVPRSKWKKPIVDTAPCSACGICVTWCRAEALRISLPTQRGDIHVFAELYQPKNCVACALCEENCPLGAIHMAEAIL